MSEELSGTGTAVELAQQLQTIYEEFSKSISALGSKGKDGRKGMSKMGEGALKWFVGNRFRSERDILSEKFAEDVENHLKTFDLALEGASEEETQQACELVADILTTTVPQQSNSTTDLMKRAMIGYLPKYLPQLSSEKLTQIKEKLETAYKKTQRLPREKEVLQSIDQLLKERA